MIILDPKLRFLFFFSIYKSNSRFKIIYLTKYLATLSMSFRVKPTDFFLLECYLKMDAKPVLNEHELLAASSLNVKKHWSIDTDEYIIRTNQLSDCYQMEIFLSRQGIRIINVNSGDVLKILKHNSMFQLNYGPLTRSQTSGRNRYTLHQPAIVYNGITDYLTNHPVALTA